MCFRQTRIGKRAGDGARRSDRDIPVHADIPWQAIRSFQGIGDWHPMLASVRGDGEQPGAIRAAVAEDGSEQVERLLEIDPVRHA